MPSPLSYYLFMIGLLDTQTCFAIPVRGRGAGQGTETRLGEPEEAYVIF